MFTSFVGKYLTRQITMDLLAGKTPVSILYEYAVSKKLNIHYELVKNGIGTHNPEFIYRVHVGSNFELGTGRSKQQAKHRAAEKLLVSLNLINNKEEEKEEDELDLRENYVGELKQYCIDNHHPEVKYFLDETAGPAHCMVFKMMCCVSQLQDFGISRTKKQAKQIAAFKMLERLKKLGNEKFYDETDSSLSQVPRPKIIQSVPAIKLTDDDIVEKYNSIKPLSAPVSQDPAAYYKDYHKAYLNLPEKSDTLSNLLKSNTVEYNKALDFVIEIAKELEVALTSTEIPQVNQESHYFVVVMTTVPPIAGLGCSEHAAASNLLKSLLLFSSDQNNSTR